MTASKLIGLRSVELGVVDVPAAVRFYTDIWGLALVANAGESAYLRGTGASYHVLALHPRARAEMLGITFDARDRQGAEALHAAAKRAGAAVTSLAAVAEPGGGYGFALRDPEGRIIRVFAEGARHVDAAPAADRP